jgi:hypothetical protein
MIIHPSSDLQIQIEDPATEDWEIDAVHLLRTIEHHIRRTVIEWWFDHRQMPPTWAEVKAAQASE